MSSPNADHIRAQVRALLTRLAGGATFRDDQDVLATGVIRSINLLELIVGVEDDHAIEVDQRDVFEGRLRSVDALVAFVTARRTVAA